VTADHFRMLFEYNRWANAVVLEKAGELSDEEYFAAALGLSFGNLHATLVHILVAEIVWLARWRGGLPPEELKDARRASEIAAAQVPTYAALRELWRAEEEKQTSFFASLADEDLERPVAYRTQYGEPNQQPLHQLLAHVFHHGAQFRAEAAVRLSQLGRSPGDLDLIVYLRQLP
jgi:uncharacterized damage-inducible protein DinB